MLPANGKVVGTGDFVACTDNTHLLSGPLIRVAKLPVDSLWDLPHTQRAVVCEWK